MAVSARMWVGNLRTKIELSEERWKLWFISNGIKKSYDDTKIEMKEEHVFMTANNL